MKKLLDYICWLLLTAATFYHFVFEESDLGYNFAILPEIGAALIGAGGSLFSSIFGGSSSASSTEATNQMNLKIARENNQFNAEQAKLNRDWQEKMWNAQNAYNDPKAAAMRSIAAGINPYIDEGSAGSIISNGAAGSAGSGAAATSASAPQMVAPNYDFVGAAVQSAVASGMQLLSGITQSQQTQAQTLDVLSKMGYYEKDYQLRKSADEIARDMLEATKEQMSYQNELTRWQSSEAAANILTQSYQRDLMKSGIKLNDMQAKSIQNELDNYAENLALRWYDAQTGRFDAVAAMKQANTLAERLAFDKNYGISDLSPEDRKKLSKENRLYLINQLIRLTGDERYMKSWWSRLTRLGNPLTGTGGASSLGSFLKYLPKF